jgi:hypothetical protein
MTITDWIGFSGVTILLAAFFLNLKGMTTSTSLIYLMLNFIGAGLACLASVMLQYWPFIILEGCWTMVSLVSLLAIFRTAKPIGEKKLPVLLKTMQPKLNSGDYVFCTSADLQDIRIPETVMSFKEEEGNTFIVAKEEADNLKLKYSFVASWITLTVHSSLEAVGLTAEISTALSQAGISCNIVAAFYHDHIFVKKSDAANAINVLNDLSNKS